MQLFSRAVHFKGDRGAGAGFALCQRDYDRTEVLSLPSDHYDFLGPLDVVGKTKDEILLEAEQLLQLARNTPTQDQS